MSALSPNDNHRPPRTMVPACSTPRSDGGIETSAKTTLAHLVIGWYSVWFDSHDRFNCITVLIQFHIEKSILLAQHLIKEIDFGV